MKTSFAMSARIVPIVSLMLLLIVLPAAQVFGQAPPTGTLWVTYVNATPTTGSLGDTLEIVFSVVYFCCDPYLGAVGNAAEGIETASFLVVSVLTQESKEYQDVPVFPTGRPGEYRAEIQIAQDNPTGRVWVYVKGNSLHSSSCFCGENPPAESLGPPGNTASEQTYDTSDLSLIEIGVVQPTTSASPWDELVQGSGLWLLLLAALIVLLLAVSLLARRRRKSTT